ncbi:hypothetical protein NL676_023984 [Syzygium grande]|nr:hypothetical protein NL676_023984 [Syzygium grande]
MTGTQDGTGDGTQGRTARVCGAAMCHATAWRGCTAGRLSKGSHWARAWLVLGRRDGVTTHGSAGRILAKATAKEGLIEADESGDGRRCAYDERRRDGPASALLDATGRERERGEAGEEGLAAEG